jgi:DNA invertase Pin-like site-specific DNA recombinase
MEYPEQYRGVRAVAYVRVSSAEQEKDGNSLPAQRQRIRDYTKKYNIRLVKPIFEDVETAKESGRTNFSRMYQFLIDHPDVRHILVEKTDRLYRNIWDYAILDKKIKPIIHLVWENEVLSHDSRSNAKMVHRIKVVFAQNYVENLSEEVIKGMDKKADKGDWPSPVPIGYIRDTRDHLIYIDRDRAPLIQDLFEAYATGNYSLKQLTYLAYDMGLRSARKKQKINKSGIHRILNNLLYTGSFIYKGRLHRGNHEKIIEPILYQRVQSILKNGSGGRRTKHDLAFRGLVKCGKCGCSMTPDIKKGKYVYYRCTGYKGPCKNWISEDQLVILLEDAIKRIHLPAHAAEALRLALQESHSDKEKYHRNAINNLTRRYNTLQQRLERAYDDRLDGVIDKETYKRKADVWNSELIEIEASISSHRQANQKYLELGNQVIELASQAPVLFEHQNNHERRKLVDFVISHSTCVDGSLCVTYRKPFNWFAEGPKTKNWRG